MLSHVVAIVSGGASGLGAAAVSSIVKNGGRVIVADLAHQQETFLRRAPGVCAEAAVAATPSDAPDRPILAFSETDVTDESQISRALDMAEAHFGEPVNVAISCAGVAVARKTLSKKGVHGMDEFRRSLEVNAMGTFNMARLSAERMATRETDQNGLRGCIINTAR
jgi:3-hydroxyacyl-CoA dehydrogenase/3-hydroxy-2-methylbutyryl-CoA dehydrogenase